MKDDVTLGGRLPLLAPKTLKEEQKHIYQYIDETIIPWATKGGFVGKTDGGLLIGPFNAFLYSPQIAMSFLQFMQTTSEHTSLSKRVQQIVILTVGSAWQADYEIYAHSAAAQKAGLSEKAITALAAGGVSDDLSPEEVLAHRFARQLTIEHKVDIDLYRDAEKAFGKDGLVNMTFLIGIYLYTSAMLNAFEVGAPQHELSAVGS